jgi:hypothetical protein
MKLEGEGERPQIKLNHKDVSQKLLNHVVTWSNTCCWTVQFIATFNCPACSPSTIIKESISGVMYHLPPTKAYFLRYYIGHYLCVSYPSVSSADCILFFFEGLSSHCCLLPTPCLLILSTHSVH